MRVTGARGGELQDQLCADAGGGAVAVATRQKVSGVKESEQKKCGVVVETSLPLRYAYYRGF